jgi:hypothetical protein
MIKFEPKKKDLYLTLSCLLDENESIIDLQKELFDSLNNCPKKDCFNYITRAEDLRDGVDDIIYRYPQNRIHFSLINFLTVPDVDDFEAKSDSLMPYFKQLNTKIDSLVADINNQKFKGVIKRIYHPDNIAGSVALNIYFEEAVICYFNKLEKELREGLKNGAPEGLKMKIYENSYFVVNLVRFIGQKSYSSDYISIDEKILEINKRLKDNPINDISFRASLVVSDPFLANKNPFI